MVRVSKVVLWLVVLPLGAGLFVTSIGIAEPYASPSDLPGTEFQGVIAGFGVVVVGLILSGLLDVLAWRRVGARAGLSPEGFVQLYSNPPGGNWTFFAKPDLTGTVRGRRVRARTYTTGGGRHSSSTTYTVVETDLETPVEWTAMIAPAGATEMDQMAGMETGGEDWTTIDGEFGVWGTLSDAEAQDVLTGNVRTALTTLDDGVVVGDVGRTVLNQMAAAVPEGSDSTSATIVSGALNAVGADGEAEPSRQVNHRERSLLLDPDELQRRARAVAAVADAVERTSR